MTANENSPPEEETNARVDSSTQSGSANAPWWYFPALLALILAVGVTFATLRGEFAPAKPGGGADTWQHDPWQRHPWQPSEAPQGDLVRLTIDFGNGTRREFEQLAWQEKMTVADLMETARGFRPGIHYQTQGQGEGMFLTSLEGVPNGGTDKGGEKRRNWLYRVNGEHAHVSIAVHRLTPGDGVTWIYDYGEGE